MKSYSSVENIEKIIEMLDWGVEESSKQLSVVPVEISQETAKVISSMLRDFLKMKKPLWLKDQPEMFNLDLDLTRQCIRHLKAQGNHDWAGPLERMLAYVESLDSSACATTSAKPPENCRQRLMSEGKPYARSSCFVCGKYAPKWEECDALLQTAPSQTKKAAPVPEFLCMRKGCTDAAQPDSNYCTTHTPTPR